MHTTFYKNFQSSKTGIPERNENYNSIKIFLHIESVKPILTVPCETNSPYSNTRMFPF